MNFQSKVTLCNSLVLSFLNYCDVVYGPALTQYDSQRLQRLQNSCVRFVYGLRRRDHVSEKIKELGWLNTRERRFLHYCNICLKLLKNKEPLYLVKRIIKRSQVHDLNIRPINVASVPQHRTSQFQNCFSYIAPKIINLLHQYNINSLRYVRELLLGGQCNLKPYYI